MTQALELVKKDKPKRVVKTKIEPIGPTHIVDVWRLVRESQLEGDQPYPDITEVNPEIIQSHLFQRLQNPLCVGLIAKTGKKPVGLILGEVCERKYGSPKRFAFIWCMWVPKNQRNTGVGQALWSDFSSKLKNSGIFHWQAESSEALEKFLSRESGIPVKKLMSIIGGKL